MTPAPRLTRLADLAAVRPSAYPPHAPSVNWPPNYHRPRCRWRLIAGTWHVKDRAV